MASLSRFVSLPRLAAGAVLVALALIPAYVFIIRDAGAPGDVTRARLVDTPLIAGRDLQTGVREGQLAADFEISRPDGERLRLSDLRGRAVLINFWALWCTSCLAEVPLIDELQTQIGRDAFTVLAINAGETPSRAQEFIDYVNLPFVYGLDLDLTVADTYGVYGLPHSIFIDASGVIRAVYRGTASRELLGRFVRAAIAAEPAGPPPAILNLSSTIPRERILLVSEPRQGSILITSRALRCDTTYCATPAVSSLEALAGVVELIHETAGGEPRLRVHYNPGEVDKAA